MAGGSASVISRFGLIRLFQVTTIVAMLAICFMSLTRSCLGTYKFGTLPATDTALVEWLAENEPNATVRVYRNPKRNLITIEHSVPLFAPEPTVPSPPWPVLGYKNGLSASLTYSAVDPYLPWPSIACGGAIVLGLWLLGRQTRRSHQPPPVTLEHS